MAASPPAANIAGSTAGDRRGGRTARTDVRPGLQGATHPLLVLAIAILGALVVDIFQGAGCSPSGSGLPHPRLPPTRDGWHVGRASGDDRGLLIVAIVAFPLGIACAVYLEEYAATGGSPASPINIRNLAGVPSIVYGLLGLSIFVEVRSARWDRRADRRRSVIAGGLTWPSWCCPS